MKKLAQNNAKYVEQDLVNLGYVFKGVKIKFLASDLRIQFSAPFCIYQISCPIQIHVIYEYM